MALFGRVWGVRQHHQRLLHRGDVRAVLSVHLRAGHGKRAPGLHYFAARDERAARRGEDVDLVLDGDERGAGGHQRVRGIAAGVVGDHADDPAVDVAFLLGNLVAVGKLDLDTAGLDHAQRRPDQGHRLLAPEALAYVVHKLLETT